MKIVSLSLGLALVFTAPTLAQSGVGERLFYMTGSEASLASLRAHADRIDVIGPQVYSVEGDGVVWGGVDPRVMAVAREHGIRVMPLIHNPGFNQQTIHDLLVDPEARRRAVRFMVEEAERYGYWGWQFDFENFHITDRDRFTEFYRETARALHARGLTISIAVVPTDGTPGPTSFHRYMNANWRQTFDLSAIAEVSDFISYMTYAQHGTITPPGPVAGLPWMRATLDHALAAGVPPEKISLGVPFYSAYWSPGTDGDRNPRVIGAEVNYSRVTALLERSGADLTWLDDQGSSYAFWERGGTFEWLFVEDRRAVETKLDLVRSYPRLHGISVWVLGAEDPAVWNLFEAR